MSCQCRSSSTWPRMPGTGFPRRMVSIGARPAAAAACPILPPGRAERLRHDRLQGVEPYGILSTGGDNDTFPPWYLQEVEGIRQDVTVTVDQYLNRQWYPSHLKRRTGPERQRPLVDDGGLIASPPGERRSRARVSRAASVIAIPGAMAPAPRQSTAPSLAPGLPDWRMSPSAVIMTWSPDNSQEVVRPMIRTQISVDEEMYARAKDAARRQGISLAELCRRSLAETLSRESASHPWMAYVGIFGGRREDSTTVDDVVYGRESP